MSRVITATICNGNAVAAELATLPEGTNVEVEVVDDDSPLTADDVAALNAAHDEADRGQLVPAAEVLTRLAARRLRSA